MSGVFATCVNATAATTTCKSPTNQGVTCKDPTDVVTVDVEPGPTLLGALTYSRLIGSATLFGITEYLPSNPPRKYLRMFADQIDLIRSYPRPPSSDWYNRIRFNDFISFNTSGVKTKSWAYGLERPGAAGGT